MREVHLVWECPLHQVKALPCSLLHPQCLDSVCLIQRQNSGNTEPELSTCSSNTCPQWAMNEMKWAMIQCKLFPDPGCNCPQEKGELEPRLRRGQERVSLEEVRFARMVIPDSWAAVFLRKLWAGRKQVRQSPGASCSEGTGFGKHPGVSDHEWAAGLPRQCSPVWETRTDEWNAEDGREQMSHLQSNCWRVTEMGAWNFISVKSHWVFPD